MSFGSRCFRGQFNGKEIDIPVWSIASARSNSLFPTPMGQVGSVSKLPEGITSLEERYRSATPFSSGALFPTFLEREGEGICEIYRWVHKESTTVRVSRSWMHCTDLTVIVQTVLYF